MIWCRHVDFMARVGADSKFRIGLRSDDGSTPTVVSSTCSISRSRLTPEEDRVVLPTTVDGGDVVVLVSSEASRDIAVEFPYYVHCFVTLTDGTTHKVGAGLLRVVEEA